jgi:hypothetical protein
MEYEFLDLADVVPGKDRLPLNWGVLGLLRKPVVGCAHSRDY